MLDGMAFILPLFPPWPWTSPSVPSQHFCRFNLFCLWSVLVTPASPAHVICSSSLNFRNLICYPEWFQPFQPFQPSWVILKATRAVFSWGVDVYFPCYIPFSSFDGSQFGLIRVLWDHTWPSIAEPSGITRWAQGRLELSGGLPSWCHHVPGAHSSMILVGKRSLFSGGRGNWVWEDTVGLYEIFISAIRWFFFLVFWGRWGGLLMIARILLSRKIHIHTTFWMSFQDVHGPPEIDERCHGPG